VPGGVDDAHVAGEDAEESGEFVKAGFAEELADRCQPAVRVDQQWVARAGMSVRMVRNSGILRLMLLRPTRLGL
jgi:hypothetical protein